MLAIALKSAENKKKANKYLQKPLERQSYIYIFGI